MSSITSLRGCADFVKANQAGLKEIFGVNSLPVYSSIRNLFAAIDYQELTNALEKWINNCMGLESGSHLAVDGKAIRAIVKNRQDKSQDYVSVVSIFDVELGIIRNMDIFENKSGNEIATFRELLSRLEADAHLTLDALHCQRKTVEAIKEADCDYTIRVKGNQKKLPEDAQSTCETETPVSEHEYESKRRNASYKVKVFRCNSPEMLSMWIGLLNYVLVERKWLNNKGEWVYEKCYFITSTNLTANESGIIIQKHWHIENALHWVKDAVMEEDRHYLKNFNMAKLYSIIRSFVINLFRSHGYRSIIRAGRLFANRLGALIKFC